MALGQYESLGANMGTPGIARKTWKHSSIHAKLHFFRSSALLTPWFKAKVLSVAI